MQDMWHTSLPLWQFIIRGAIVYIAVLALMRLGGKRQIGQMGVGDFVAILLISNAVQNSMNGGDNSITGGIILASTIIILSTSISYITYKSKRWENIIQGRPTLLVHKGKVLPQHMKKELLNNYELKALLRRQGVHSIDEIAEAILESDGTLSITKESEIHRNSHPTRDEAQ